MKAIIEKDASNPLENVLLLHFAPNKDDENFYAERKAKLNQTSIYFKLPNDVDISNIHPDLILLTTLLAIKPFTHKTLEININPSQLMVDACKIHLSLNIVCSKPLSSQRKKPKDGNPGLAFSGGSDSIAALSIMPKNTVCIFLQRSSKGAVKSLYKDDAAIHSCKLVRKSGYSVEAIQTSLEYVRNPVGFPLDWSNSTPIILLSDHFKINSINFGMVLESSYGIGHTKYSDLRNRNIYKNWSPLFDVANIPISLPTAGLSEVITQKIACTTAKNWDAQSCVRGAVNLPCMKCFKCFRKVLLDSEVGSAKLQANHFQIAKNSKEVARRLLERPIHHENVLAYSLRNTKTNDPIGKILIEKIASLLKLNNNLNILEKFYSPAANLIDPSIREFVLSKISEVSQSTNFKEIDEIESWDTSYIIKLEDYESAQKSLFSLISDPIK